MTEFAVVRGERSPCALPPVHDTHIPERPQAFDDMHLRLTVRAMHEISANRSRTVDMVYFQFSFIKHAICMAFGWFSVLVDSIAYFRICVRSAPFPISGHIRSFLSPSHPLVGKDHLVWRLIHIILPVHYFF